MPFQTLLKLSPVDIEPQRFISAYIHQYRFTGCQKIIGEGGTMQVAILPHMTLKGSVDLLLEDFFNQMPEIIGYESIHVVMWYACIINTHFLLHQRGSLNDHGDILSQLSSYRAFDGVMPPSEQFLF